MNRHEKRRKAAMERSNNLVKTYVRHLPEMELGDFGSPGVKHMVIHHDDWCELYSGRGPACNCNPIVKYFKEPSRS